MNDTKALSVAGQPVPNGMAWVIGKVKATPLAANDRMLLREALAVKLAKLQIEAIADAYDLIPRGRPR